MLRIVVELAVIALVIRAVAGRWPWQMLALPPSQVELNRARTLLGLDRGASRDDILAAHRQLVARVHPDRGGSSELVHEANDARDLLLANQPARHKE